MRWKISKKGYGSIAGHEAIYLYVYPDPGTGGKPWTGGIGHTAAAGGWQPKPGQKITLRQALDIFKQDMKKYEAGVNRAIGPYVKTQHSFDGFVSFHFNTGAIASGSVDDRIRAGDMSGALRVLNMYTKAGGRRMAGLVKRRKEETTMITTGKYPTRKILLKERPGTKGRYLDPRSLPWDQEQLPVSSDLDLNKTVSKPVPVPTKQDPLSNNFVWSLVKLLWRKFLK